MAQRLKIVFMAKGYEFLSIRLPTSSLFVLPPAAVEKLSKSVKLSFWEALPDGRIVVRFTTSWATPEQKYCRAGKNSLSVFDHVSKNFAGSTWPDC
jgi:threonine aldolase